MNHTSLIILAITAAIEAVLLYKWVRHWLPTSMGEDVEDSYDNY
ncbi:MAG: hypothetical protein ACYC4K_10840 [Thiobacillus sp.]